MILIPFLARCEALLARIAFALATWVGSWSFVFWHTVIFLSWRPLGWDFNNLLMVINIETIYLMCVLLMAQNRSEAKSQQEELERYKYIIKILASNKALDERIDMMVATLAKTNARIEKRLGTLETKRGLFL